MDNEHLMRASFVALFDKDQKEILPGQSIATSLQTSCFKSACSQAFQNVVESSEFSLLSIFPYRKNAIDALQPDNQLATNLSIDKFG